MSAPEHDPLCVKTKDRYSMAPCECDRLRAARADERERAAERVESSTTLLMTGHSFTDATGARLVRMSDALAAIRTP